MQPRCDAAVATPEGHIETLDDLRDRFRDWHAPIPDVLGAADADNVVRHEIHDLTPHLRSFVATGRDHNVALVGDAAHAMTPALGQGACQALLDAVALTGALDAAGDVASALAAYDRERRKPAQRVVTASRWLSRISGTHRFTSVRNALMRMLPV